MDVSPNILIPDVDSPPGAPIVLPETPDSIQPKPEFPPVLRYGDLIYACFPVKLRHLYSMELMRADGYLYQSPTGTAHRYGDDPLWHYGSVNALVEQVNTYPGWTPANISPYPSNYPPLFRQTQTMSNSYGMIEYNGVFVTDWDRASDAVQGVCHVQFANTFAYLPEDLPTACEIRNSAEWWNIFYRRIDSFDVVDDVVIIPIVAAILSQFALLAASSCLTVPPVRRRRHP